MALVVRVLPGQRASVPGGLLLAEVQVANKSDKFSHSPFRIYVKELLVDFVGTERVDRTWVGLTYGADTPPVEKDNRRETRAILQSKPVCLSTGLLLAPGEQRSWAVRLPLPDWLPPSFRGVTARYSYVLTATIRFSASSAAMKLITHHLSIEGVRRGTGSLSLVPPLSTSLPQSHKIRSKEAAPPSEQTAVAKVPTLVMPLQRLRNDFIADRRGMPALPAILTGEDAELQAIPYSHAAATSLLQMEATVRLRHAKHCSELRGEREAKPVEHLSLPRGISLSRSDLTSLPDGADRSTSAVRPVDAWPAMPPLDSRTAAGNDAVGKAQDTAAIAERQSPLPPTTPLTGLDATTSRSFNLRLADALLVRLALCPPADNFVGLGMTLSGTLDFRSSQEACAQDPNLPKCIQVAVLLETEEQIHSRWTAGLATQASASSIRKVQDEHQELTPDTLLTHFMLSIPFDAPASFSTHLLALRWVLRFEFTTTMQTAGSGWFGGYSQGMDRLSWSLPILVKPSR